MNGSSSLPSIEAPKGQAKRLRVELENGGPSIDHNRSLELLTRRHGYKAWNTIQAAIGNQPQSRPVALGQRVSGHHLERPHEGDLIGVKKLTAPGRFQVSFDVDEPVDVVTFQSFPSFRKRASCSAGTDGMTVEKTSNEQPRLRLDLQGR